MQAPQHPAPSPAPPHPKSDGDDELFRQFTIGAAWVAPGGPDDENAQKPGVSHDLASRDLSPRLDERLYGDSELDGVMTEGEKDHPFAPVLPPITLVHGGRSPAQASVVASDGDSSDHEVASLLLACGPVAQVRLAQAHLLVADRAPKTKIPEVGPTAGPARNDSEMGELTDSDVETKATLCPEPHLTDSSLTSCEDSDEDIGDGPAINDSATPDTHAPRRRSTRIIRPQPSTHSTESPLKAVIPLPGSIFPSELAFHQACLAGLLASPYNLRAVRTGGGAIRIRDVCPRYKSSTPCSWKVVARWSKGEGWVVDGEESVYEHAHEVDQNPSEASSSVKAIPVKRPAAAPVESGAKKVKVTPARVHSQKGQTRVYV